MPDAPDPALHHDPAAAASFVTNAGEISTLLASAATAADVAAAADLSGLGLLGRDFAAAWLAAVSGQSATMRIAESVTSAHGSTVATHSAALVGADDTNASDIGATGAGVDDAVQEQI